VRQQGCAVRVSLFIFCRVLSESAIDLLNDEALSHSER